MLHTCCTLAYYCAGVTSLNLATDDLFLVAMWNSLVRSLAIIDLFLVAVWNSLVRSLAIIQVLLGLGAAS